MSRLPPGQGWTMNPSFSVSAYHSTKTQCDIGRWVVSYTFTKRRWVVSFIRSDHFIQGGKGYRYTEVDGSWAPDPVWKGWRKEKIPDPEGHRTELMKQKSAV